MDSKVFTAEYLEDLSYQDLKNLSKDYGVYKRHAKKVSIIKKLIGLRKKEDHETLGGDENMDPNEFLAKKRKLKKSTPSKESIGLRGSSFSVDSLEHTLKSPSSNDGIWSRRSRFSVKPMAIEQTLKMSSPPKGCIGSRRSTFTVNSTDDLPSGPIPEECGRIVETFRTGIVSTQQEEGSLFVEKEKGKGRLGRRKRLKSEEPGALAKTSPTTSNTNLSAVEQTLKMSPSSKGSIESRRSTFTVNSTDELPSGPIPEECGRIVETSQTEIVSTQQKADSLFVEKEKGKGRLGRRKRLKSEEAGALPKTPTAISNTNLSERRSCSEKKLKLKEEDDGSPKLPPKRLTPLTSNPSSRDTRKEDKGRSVSFVNHPPKTSSTLGKRITNVNLLSVKKAKILSSVKRTPRTIPKLFSNDDVSFLKTPVSQKKVFGTASGRKLGTLPNFKAIHEKNFTQMESLFDGAKRKAQRALKLLTPTRTKKPSGIPIPSFVKDTNARPGSSNLTFSKVNSGIPTAKKDQVKKVIKQGRLSEPMEKTREKQKLAVTGVRMNKRFELLMKMRTMNCN